MKTLYEIKLQKGRIDAERKRIGLREIYGTCEKEDQPRLCRCGTVLTGESEMCGPCALDLLSS